MAKKKNKDVKKEEIEKTEEVVKAETEENNEVAEQVKVEEVKKEIVVEDNSEEKEKKDEIEVEKKEEVKEEKSLIKRKKKYKRIKYNKKTLVILAIIALVIVLVSVWYKFLDKRNTGLTNVKGAVISDSKEIMEKENTQLEPGQTIKVSRTEFVSGIAGLHKQEGKNISDTSFELNVDIIFKYGKKQYKALGKAVIENSNYDTEYEMTIVEEVEKIDTLYELGYKVINDDTDGIKSINYKELESTRTGMVVNYKDQDFYVLFDGDFNITIDLATEEQLNMPTLGH